MKIYILADMEGISGIRKMEQVFPEHSEYKPACELMMADINAAVAAAFEAGAMEVVVCDTHGPGGQVLVDRMDPRASYEIPNAGRMMPSLDESFAGLILLGHHAKAGTLNGFLDHTMSSAQWFEFKINDRVVGEIGIEAAYAAHYGVPVIAVSGDEALAVEARDLFDDVECAVVKKGIGRNKANCLSIPEAHKRIREAILTAIQHIDRFSPWAPNLPATLELTLYRSDMADAYATRKGIERINARTLRAQIESLRNIGIFMG